MHIHMCAWQLVALVKQKVIYSYSFVIFEVLLIFGKFFPSNYYPPIHSQIHLLFKCLRICKAQKLILPKATGLPNLIIYFT